MEYKAFVIHIVTLNIDSSDEMHPLNMAQIAHLKVNKVSTKVSSKYTDFTDVFLPKLVIKLLEYIKINDYAIKLVDNWQLPYGPIYSLGLI